MWSLQLVLCSCWDFVDESVEVEWSPSNQEDLLWWSDLSNLLQGVSLEEVHPDLLFWLDASDQGWVLISATSLFRASGLRRSAPCPSIFGSFARSVFASSSFVICCWVWWSGSSRTTPPLSLTSGNGGDVLPGTQRRSPAPPSLGRGVGDHFGSPELSPSGSGVRMDLLPGCCRLPPDFVAGDSGSLRRGHELSPASLFLTARRSDVSRHGYLSSGVRWAAGVGFSAIRPDSTSFAQVPRLQGNSSHINSPLLATERVIPRAPESGCGSSGAPFHFGEIFSDSGISIACTRTSLCFAFMRGDYTAIRSRFRSFQTGRHAALSLPQAIFTAFVSTPLGVLQVLVH